MSTRPRPGRLILAVSACVLLPALVTVSPAPANGAIACAGWTLVPSPSRGSATLSAVAATSGRNAWAVGTYSTGSAYRTLIEHWNGASWRIVRSPDPASGALTTNTLSGVVAISRSDAWAFGFYEKPSTSFRTLIEHWNGVRWSVVPSPDSGTGENTFSAAAVVNASSIWAVGYRQGTGARQTLIEHWNGARWMIVPSPNVGSGDNFLFGVAAVSAGLAWAVGSDSVSFGRTLAIRWNGSAWSVVPTVSRGQGDRFLQAIAAPSARYALAVGSDLNGTQTQALAERWRGSAWTLVPARSPGADYNSLQAVTAPAASNAWAVGARRNALGQAFRTLAEHWNGSAWTVPRTPSPGSGDDWLYGIGTIPRHGGFWAVGTAGGRTLTEFHC